MRNAATLSLTLAVLLAAVGCRTPTVERETSFGTVRGTSGDGAEAYRGLRYGEAPQGLGRWQLAVAPPASDEVVEATTWGSDCAQRALLTGTFRGTDDCLVVNVWTPVGAQPGDARPVMVFVHGGGNVSGSSADRPPGASYTYDGTAFARDEGVVLVTLNYRLGPFGFAAIEGAVSNLGLRDQQAALRWVQDHIASFGGDPGRVLLFGESGGGQDVCAHLASPLSAGLFHVAIVQSGSCLQPEEAHRAASIQAVLSATDCSSLPCLSERSSREIALGLPREEGTSWMAAGLNAWGPWPDGEVLLDSPHRVLAGEDHPRVPFVLGTNDKEHVLFPAPVDDCASLTQFVRDEVTALGARASEGLADDILARYPCSSDEQATTVWGALIDDVRFHCPARLAVEGASAHGEVWHYLLERGRDRGLFGGQGAFHGVELGFLFGTTNNPTDEEVAFGNELRHLWAELAANGAPPAERGWPLAGATMALLRLDDTSVVDTDVFSEACSFWDGRLPLQ